MTTSRRSFFERMQREVDFQAEYVKIDKIVCCEEISISGYIYSLNSTIEQEIEKHFRKWDRKDNYASFTELRSAVGFEVKYTNKEARFLALNVTMEDFFAYCEMLLNVVFGLGGALPREIATAFSPIIDIIRADIAKLNHEIHVTGDKGYLIVQSDAAASSVADITPVDTGDAFIKYNHYLLKGDINKKRDLLKRIDLDLEPKRKRQHKPSSSSAIEDDLSFLLNNMNIRHNNADPSNVKYYNPEYSHLSNQEIEYWYDETYQLALLVYLAIDNESRTEKVKALKQNR